MSRARLLRIRQADHEAIEAEAAKTGERYHDVLSRAIRAGLSSHASDSAPKSPVVKPVSAKGSKAAQITDDVILRALRIEKILRALEGLG